MRKNQKLVVALLLALAVVASPAFAWTITASAGANGTISPTGAVVVVNGSNQTFTITPNLGYHVNNVVVDGGSVGAVMSYPFTNVLANHTIAASFAINTYTITPTAGANGSISPNTPQTVNYGASQTFTVKPLATFVARVLINGIEDTSMATGNSITGKNYIFTHVSGNYTIDATFAQGTPVISPVIGPRTITAQTTLSFQVSATDPAGHDVTWSLDLPSIALGMTIGQGAGVDRMKGNFSWTPTRDQIGNHTVVFKAEDAGGNFAFEDVVITVNVCGDVDGSNQVDISDAVYLWWYIFNDTQPTGLSQANANGCGPANIADVLFLIWYIFGGGPAPFSCENSLPCGNVDTGIPDSIRVGCVVQANPPVAGDSIGIPIYIWNDEKIGGFSLGFKYNSDLVEITSWSLSGSVIPFPDWATFSPRPDQNQVLIGYSDFSAYNPIPVTAGNKAKLLATLWMRFLPGINAHTIDIDSTFVGPAGNFVLSSQEGFEIRPRYKDCGTCDVNLGNVPAGAPHIVTLPTSLSFSALQSEDSLFETLSLSNSKCGQTLSWTAASNQPWLTLNPTSGINNGSTIIVRATTTNLPAGVHSAIITISSNNADNSPIQIPVECIIRGFTVQHLDFDTVASNATNIPLLKVNLAGFSGDTLVSVKVRSYIEKEYAINRISLWKNAATTPFKTYYITGRFDANFEATLAGFNLPLDADDTLRVTVDAWTDSLDADTSYHMTGLEIAIPPSGLVLKDGPIRDTLFTNFLANPTINASTGLWIGAPAYVVTITTTVPESMADLFVSTNDIQLLPENPYAGQDVTISVKVHNIGQTGAGGFDVQVVGDSAFVSPIADLMIDYLPAGSDTVVHFQWTADASVNQLYVRLDSHHSVPELSELNNIAMKPVNVISPSGLTVTIAPDAIYAELRDTAAYEVTVVNSTTGFHRVALSASSMGSLPYRFDRDTLELAPGAWSSTKLRVQSGTGCAGYTGTLNFQVQEKAIDNVALSSSTEAQLVITANPVLSQFLPASNQTLASNSVTFMWTSRTSSSSTVYYRKVSAAAYSVAPGSAGVAHNVVVNNLEYNTDYIWYAKSVSACGTDSSGLLRFHTGHGVTFENHRPHFLVKRNYNQKSNISIVNSDTMPHQVLVKALNPYSDLIVGFTEAGSVDQVVELPPGGSLALNLAIHSQDAQDTNYVMAFRLTSTGHDSSKVYDYASAYITIDWPDTNFTLQVLGLDPLTLVRSMRLLNYGDSISDFSVTVSDAVGIDYFATPQIEHALLGPNQHIDFQLIPTFDDTITLQGQRASCRAVVTATGAGKSVSIQLAECCQKSIFNVSKPNALVCSDLAAESWYCTNRPVIDVDVSSPRILSGTVTKGILSINFTPVSSVLPHNLTIYLNGHLIHTLTNTVPNGTMSFDVDPAFVSVSNSGPAVNHLQLVSIHLNGGHYIVAAEFSLCLCVNNYAEYICASSAGEALTILNSRPYLFAGSPSSVEIISPSGGDINKWTNTPIKVQVTPAHRKYDANVNVNYASGGSQSLKLNYDSQQQIYIGELQPQNCGDAAITASVGKCGPSLQDNVSVSVINCDQSIVPVVLVHGWKGNPSAWDNMKVWLHLDGFPEVWTPSLSPCGVPGERQFDLNSRALSDAIEAQRDMFQQTHGYRPNKINIIAHSMGGMIARRYAASNDSWSAHSKGVTVEKLIMLGTPNGGVRFATILSTLTLSNCFLIPQYCALLEAASFALCPGPANAEFAPGKVDAFNRNRALNTYHSSTRYVGIAGIQGLQLPICLSLLGCPNDGFINTQSVLEAYITLPDGSRTSVVDRAIPFPDPSFVPIPIKSTLHSLLPRHRAIYEGWVRPELQGTAIPSSAPANNFAMSNTYSDTTGISFNNSYLGFIHPLSVVAETLHVAASSALNILADNFGANMSITLQSASGAIFDSTDTSGSYTEVEGLISYTIPNPTPGAWLINITTGALADTVSPYFVVAEMEDGIEMTTWISSSFVEARDSVLIFSKLIEAGSPITGASVTCEGFTNSAGLALSRTLRDNGTWPDATANDGIYSAAWIPQDSLGSINILVKSTGLSGRLHRESVLNTFVTSRPTWICGDADGYGSVNIADVVFLIDYIFRGGPAPNPLAAGDANCDGHINIADVVYLINYIFTHGPAPCGEECK